jgi:hypothetical protein
MNSSRVPPQKEKAQTPTDWELAAVSRIAELRKRLLDLTNANRLLNFKFRDRSRSYVRVIETVPDAMFAKLAEGEQFQFRSLPEKTDEPPDEKTDRFLMALEQARLSDTVPRRCAQTQASRMMSAPVACTAKLPIDRALNSTMPVHMLQPNGVHMSPASSARAIQSSIHTQNF